MQSCQADASTKSTGNKPGHIVHALMGIYGETREALGSVSGWDRAAHIFWLLGPFILLVERSPADMWLSVIALSFAGPLSCGGRVVGFE